MRKLTIANAMVAVFAGTSMAGQILAGGDIPLVNNIVGIGVITLDFSSDGDDVDIAKFIINNNSNSFDVTWTFTNSAEFQKTATEAIPMTTLTIEPGVQPAGSHLGTDVEILDPATAWDGVDQTAGDILAQAQIGDVVWNPTDQTDATLNYLIQMKASWVNSNLLLAGLYTEQIEFGIVATIL
jgi:hypothetical protein